ncbi:ADP-ribosylglycohydrolase family protein, partial [candidate division KSB1 bacterium]|nr:ADP-ribosylglycohydrolase family protein [candidate division KSB1 bacterium]
TEMDKIGNIGSIKTGAFYTRENWNQADQPNIWNDGETSTLSKTIDFIWAEPDSIWGADDDTDIEYIYQDILYSNKTSFLTGEQISQGWLTHIKPEEENYLWVSNQKAFDRMRQGMVPPQTSDPRYNEHYEMIDAQLTTEIFGLYAPTRPDIALKMAWLPIRTTARENAAWIAEFYVIMHSLALQVDASLSMKEQIQWMAEQARLHLPDSAYCAKMYDFVKSQYGAGLTWEEARDNVYQRYQVEQADGYTMTSRNLHCNACFAAGINFAASLVSLFWGEGDILETIKIGALAGWDSDNPTSTWGGLLGFMLGKNGVEQAFGRQFSEKFHIHRTRIGFPNDGIDTFSAMAQKGVFIIDRVVQEHMGGGIDLEKNVWYLPEFKLQIPVVEPEN